MTLMTWMMTNIARRGLNDRKELPMTNGIRRDTAAPRQAFDCYFDSRSLLFRLLPECVRGRAARSESYDTYRMCKKQPGGFCFSSKRGISRHDDTSLIVL